MHPIDFHSLAAIARQLDLLQTPYAFTGGAIVGFLLDHPHLASLRPTADVDVIVAVITHLQHAALEARLRKLGFHHDTSAGAPICRWRYLGTRVDIMPAQDTAGQKSNPWFAHALRGASLKTWDQVTARIVSATSFVATKLVAFADRGRNDFFGSHDLEDVVTIVDGRAAFVDELAAEEPTMRNYVGCEIRRLLGLPKFIDSLPGHLASDEASQQRLPMLLSRLQAIADLCAP